MHAQDGRQPIGRSPLTSFWVVRPDLLQQTLPGNQHLHPLRKSLPPRLTLLPLLLKVRKALLHALHASNAPNHGFIRTPAGDLFKDAAGCFTSGEMTSPSTQPAIQRKGRQSRDLGEDSAGGPTGIRRH